MVINEGEIPSKPHKLEKQTKIDKQHSKLEKQEKSQKSSTKVIIRRLPPSMSLEDFITHVSPIPSYNHIYTIKGNHSLGPQAAFSRVYVNFANLEDVYMFKEKFDNYIFIDSQNGHEYAAVVEFAAFQKVPKRRKQRMDLKVDTIEKDPAYIQFIEDLKEGNDPDIKPEFNMNLNTGKNEEMTTPLLDFLKQRKVERMKMREEKREERRKKEQEKKRIKEEDKRRRIKSLKEAQKETKDEQKERKTKDNEKENKDELNLKELDGYEDKTNKSDKDEKSMSAKPEPVRTFKSSKFDKHDKQQFSKAKKYEDSKKVKKLTKEKPIRNLQVSEKDKNVVEKKPEEKPLKKVKKYSERREERKLASISSTASSESQQMLSKSTEANEEGTSNQPEEEKIPHRVHDDERKKQAMKENDTRAQRRIRNKDRPAMQIYKPGMLRKKSVDNNEDEKAVSPSVPAKQDKQEGYVKEMTSSVAFQE